MTPTNIGLLVALIALIVIVFITLGILFYTRRAKRRGFDTVFRRCRSFGRIAINSDAIRILKGMYKSASNFFQNKIPPIYLKIW